MRRPVFVAVSAMVMVWGSACNSRGNVASSADSGIDAGSGGGAGAADGSGTDAVVAGDGAATMSPPFVPTMWVTIDGHRKGYRLSRFGRLPNDPETLVVEFSSGIFRYGNLGAEATPGEMYSEVWLNISPGVVPISGAYGCAPSAGATPPGRSVAIIWSFNHAGLGPNPHDFSTRVSGGPCAAAFESFGGAPGDRMRGTFSADLEGGHILGDGVIDVVVPSEIPPGGQ